MQVQCHQCQQWTETDTGVCQVCGASLDGDTENRDNSDDTFKKNERDRKRKSIITLLCLVLVVIVVVLGFIYWLMSPTKKEKYEEWRKQFWDERFACDPDWGYVKVPDGADDVAMEAIAKRLYHEHQTDNECAGSWSWQCDTGWYIPANSFAKEDKALFEGMWGGFMFPCAADGDGMRLYIRGNGSELRSSDSIDFFVRSATSPLDSKRSLVPVNNGIVLYGIDKKSFKQSRLVQDNKGNYVFADVSLFDSIENDHFYKRLKIVFPVESNLEIYMIYRVYIIDKDKMLEW